MQKGDKVFIHSLKKRGEIKDVKRSTFVVEYTLRRDDKLRTIKEEFTNDEISLYKNKPYNPNEMYYLVKGFHKAFDAPAPNKPTMLSKERIEARNSWMLEECRELEEATTLEDQVDAAIDKLYFAIGDLVELGVKPFNLFKIVNDANMGKLWEDGKPRFREGDNKIIKPPHWEENYAPEPKLKAEIQRQSR